jgi:hypothetical protein
MHWEWKNCPPKWIRRPNHSDRGVATIVLEAIASQDLQILHASYSVFGSVNVLDGSSFFTEGLKLGEASQVQLPINKSQYNMGYTWPVKSTQNALYSWRQYPSLEEKRSNCLHDIKKRQRGMSKEHLDYFNLVFFPLCVIQYDFLRQQLLAKSYKACIILHNTVIKNEKDMAKCLL